MSWICHSGLYARGAVSALWICLCSLAWAESVQIGVNTQQPMMALPGDFLTLTLSLEHDGLTAQSFRERLELPPGWQSVLPLENIVLEPGAVMPRSFLIMIPEHTAVDAYSIQYFLESDHRSYQQAMVVNVLPQQRIVMTPLHPLHERVLAGHKMHWRLRVFNAGNTPTDLRVEQRLSVHGEVQLEAQHISLPAQFHQDLDVWITPAATIEKPTRASLRLSVEDNNGGVVQQLRHSFEVIPRTSGADPMLRYPLLLRSTVRSAAGASGHQPASLEKQWSLSGAGFVDEEKRHRVSFLTTWRSPQATHQLVDRFWFRYQHQRLTLRGGDQLFRLSPLTLPARFGRGVGIDLRAAADWQMGVFSLTSTLREVRSEVVAGYLTFMPQADWQFQLHGFRQLDAAQEAGTQDPSKLRIVGFQARYSRSFQSYWEAEVAQSLQTSAEGLLAGHAARFDAATGMKTKHGRSRLGLRLTYAQPSFGGLRNNLFDASLSATWPIRASVDSRWSYRYFARNLARDPSLGPVVTEQRWTSDWFWALTQRWHFSLGYHQHHLQATPSTRSALTHTGQVGLGYRNEHWRWQGRVYQSVTAAQHSEPIRLGGFMNAQYRWSSQWSARAQVGWLQRRQSGPPQQLTTRRVFLLQSQWQPTSQWFVAASYRRGDAYDLRWSEQQLRQSWSVESQYQWRDQHELRLQWRQQLSHNQQPSSTLELSYILKLAPALRHRQTVGSLHGLVSLQKGTELMPVADALVRIHDQAAFTDAEGFYELNSLPPQRYPVRVEWPHGEATLLDYSAEAEVEGGQNLNFLIVIQPPGTVSGQLNLAPLEHASTLAELLLEPPQLANIQVVVFNHDHERYFVPADAQGQFRLSGLTPGLWQVQVVAASLPSRLQASPSLQQLQIMSGQTSSVEINLNWVVPSFNWLEQGESILVVD